LHLSQGLNTHGFRETQSCGTYHDIARHVDKGDNSHAVVHDFGKAFDKVSHKLLMQKLFNIPNVSRLHR